MCAACVAVQLCFVDGGELSHSGAAVLLNRPFERHRGACNLRHCLLRYTLTFAGKLPFKLRLCGTALRSKSRTKEEGKAARLSSEVPFAVHDKYYDSNNNDESVIQKGRPVSQRGTKSRTRE